MATWYSSQSWTIIFLCLQLLIEWNAAQTSICETILPTIAQNYSSLNLTAEYEINKEAISASGVNTDLVNYSGMRITNNETGPSIEVNYYVKMYDSGSNPDKVNITFSFTNLEPSRMSLVSVKIDLQNKVNAIWDIGVTGAFTNGRSFLEYNKTNLAANTSFAIWFIATPAGQDGTDLPESPNNFDAPFYFTTEEITAYATKRTTYGTFLPSICLFRKIIIIENIVYQHGFTVLTFFIMFFVGIGLVILIVWLIRRRRTNTVNATKSDDNQMRNKGKNIVMDAKDAMKRGVNPIKDFSLIAWNESLVTVLGLNDKLKMYREIDNLDILSTINIDTDLELEHNDAAVQASLLLVQGLRYNNDITKSTEEKTKSNLQNRLKELDKKLEADFKKELQSLYIDIEAKNKEKLGELHRKHKEKKQEIIWLSKDLPETEKKQILDLLDKQEQVEENELTYKLALEQNEEAEKLRKEYSTRKRVGIKELQQQFVNEVISSEVLPSEKADWLIKEHKRQQEEIAKKYDDEISLQRMLLEEKLAKRRALAQASEAREDDDAKILSLVASGQLNIIQKLKSSKKLSNDEAEDYTDQVTADVQAVKTQMDKEKDLKLKELVKKLNQAKAKALADEMSQQASQVQDYIAKNKSPQTDGPVDPNSYIRGFINLKSQHRRRLHELENEIDGKHAKELDALRDQIAETAKQSLKTNEQKLIQRIKTQDVDDSVIEKILRNHDKVVKETIAQQIANRQNQESKFQNELAKRKKGWDEMRANEKQEQQDLREYELEVVDKLLGSQVALSEDERERILKEHEKNMVKLENSLTLNKLRQKRMIEEKIAQRQAQQMEELQQKQYAEIMKHRRVAENNGEEEDEGTKLEELKIRKKHAEQQITLIQNIDFNFDKELEEIRVDMIKERAYSLKEQEEKLGALITSLQMTKARELAKIEEQQKAINNLKGNLLDDLNARGILSTPDCEKIITRHREEQDELTTKLDNYRSVQEETLRKKLQDRLLQRENTMVLKQEEEMKMLIQQSTNKTSAKIRRALLNHKHIVAMEKFKNKLQREINQTMEDTKRELQLQKHKMLQDQEMKFLAGLVKIGEFERNELLDVLHMLFPRKTEEAITEMLNKIYVENKSTSKNMEKSQSTLAERVYKEQYMAPLGRAPSATSKSLVNRKPVEKTSGRGVSVIDQDRRKNTFGPQDYSRREALINQSEPQNNRRKNSVDKKYLPPINNAKRNLSESDEEDDEYYDLGTNYSRNKLESQNKAYVRQPERSRSSAEVRRPQQDVISESMEDDDYSDNEAKFKYAPEKVKEQPKQRKKKFLKKLAHHSDDDDEL
ncbi:trichohyalin-like [Physella acuta]|uniref:trichohyalin-like n=1 Tax=Physella acuta TaxID=109671 RepID=UPI0027DE3EC3|nr:trichohyalin-like [Physella acuta]XP_059163331.1 trichohyalin-like [Physella acuta]XP_059163332.1 trichohyalin-like [Physella acuta]